MCSMAICPAKIMPDGRSRLIRCILILSVLDTFLFGVTLTTGIVYSSENNSFLSFFPLGRQCLPCTNLAHHPDDSLVGIKRSKDHTSCCAIEKANIPDLVNQFAGKWLKGYQAKTSPEYHGCRKNDGDQEKNNPKKDFFKIHGFEGQRLNATHHRRVHWDEDTALNSENMQYKHGYVTIPQTGLYQIYSQIVADFDEEPNPHTGHLNLFRHQIAVRKHHGNNGERCIIISTLSQCETKQDGYIKSNIGTVYRFNKGDRVVVKASYPERIRPNPRMNFFGIHMI